MNFSEDSPKKETGLKTYVPAAKTIPEFTLQSILLGFLLSIVFNAANAYLGLKIGMTVSASIPSAIISMGVFRMILPRILRRDGTILENNIVHAFASNGESLAAAIIFTVPALLFLGGQITNLNVFLLGMAGGFLGILMMIPLRHSLMVKEHHALPFPEGTACAEVLIAGDRGGSSAAPVFWGIFTGGLYKFAMSGFNLFKDVLMWSWPSLNMAGFGYDVSPLLVGVGYLVGLRIAAVMFAGGILGYWVLIPMIHYLGGHNIVFPGTIPIDAMSTGDLRATYVRYIGAGGVAFGGLISLLKSLPDIFGSVRHSLAALKRADEGKGAGAAGTRDREHQPIVWGGTFLGFLVGALAADFPWHLGSAEWSDGLRLVLGLLAHFGFAGGIGALLGWGVFTYFADSSAAASSKFQRDELDLPLPVVGLGIVAMFLFIWLTPTFHMSFLETFLVLLFAFFFVAVASRMVGLIGTTNQPVSGMTITALLLLTLLFTLLGHDPATLRSAAIMGGAIVCIAISLSGDLSQDLKTAALIGATPWKVEAAQIMASLVSAVRSGFILLILYKAYGFGSIPTPQHPHPLEAPQAQLMADLVRGATGGNLPWTMLLVGAGIGLVAEFCGISALALSIGLYLPITNWPMILIGGLIAWFVARGRGKKIEEHDPGSLFASGLIAGDALMGIALALVTVAGPYLMLHGHPLDQLLRLREPDQGNAAFEALLSTAMYAGICALLYRYATRKPKGQHA